MVDADLQNADLRGVIFKSCDLQKAQFSSAKLEGADLRSSRIEGIGGSPHDLKGAIISPDQVGILAWNFVKAFGIVVKGDGEA